MLPDKSFIRFKSKITPIWADPCNSGAQSPTLHVEHTIKEHNKTIAYLFAGQDPDPLRWVRESREQINEVQIVPRKQRRQHLQQLSDNRSEGAGSAATSGEEDFAEDGDEEGQEVETGDESSAAADDVGNGVGVVIPALPRAEATGDDAAADTAVPAKQVAQKLLAHQLAQELDIDGVLRVCERLWPDWAANGCRMIELVRSRCHPAELRLGSAPSCYCYYCCCCY